MNKERVSETIRETPDYWFVSYYNEEEKQTITNWYSYYPEDLLYDLKLGRDMGRLSKLRVLECFIKELIQ